MKKLFLTLVAFLMAVMPAFSENVTVQTAQRAAQSFLNSKMGGNSQIHLIDFAEKTEFPNFYVFGNEHCFVIIAADNIVHPVLGYSMEGGFGEDAMPEAIMDWLKAYDDEITFAKESRLEATMEIRKEWDNLLNGRGLEPKSRSFVKPLIRTKWSQKLPFNNLCPIYGNGNHCAAGCGAIAMAQIMNYWEHPVRGVGSHSYLPHSHPEYDTLSVNFSETTYDWDNIKNLYTRGYSSDEALAVATLVYHCGVSVNMDYGPDTSNVAAPILDSAMRYYFDYASTTNYVFKLSYSNTQWISMLKNDLDNLQPLLYRACSDNQGTNAHIFVCDGYDENDFFHFEWGVIGGRFDGYYTIADLHQGSTNYTYGNAAMFGCHPNETSINPPSNVVTTVNGRTVNISWSPVPSSAYYKVYRDGDLIANNLTSTSYTDSNASYGSHTYYVKSVKSDGTMSLRSNIATVDLHFTGPVPSNLQATANSQNVNLSWQTPNAETAILQYGTGACTDKRGYSGGTYWGQRYPASTISEYAGMAIEKVSSFFYYAGNYTLFVYMGEENNPNELLFQQSFNAAAESWHDIVFPEPVSIDYTQDLWVVFYSNIGYPAPLCDYNLPDKENAALYSNQYGIIWSAFGPSYSCMMKTYLTDGIYTYNLYRDGNIVVNNLTGSSYTDANVPDGFYDYQVTTNYFGGESDPSNTVHVQVGNPTYSVSVSANPSNGGTVTGGGTYYYNQSCTVTATPNTGYTFTNWMENGNVVSTNSSFSFIVNANRTLVAHFDLQSFTISASANPSNGGSVSGGGIYSYGQTCTLSATAANGYNFVNWTENGNVVSTDATYSFTVYANQTLVANFQLDNLVVTVSADPANGGSVTGGGAFHYGDNCTVIATANPGFNFVNWTEDGTQVSSSNPYYFTVTSNRELVAHFTSQNYVITATADPEYGGTITGMGGYNYGETCTLVATANVGFEFSKWTKNGTQVSTDSSYSFTVTESANYVAHFAAQSYTVNVSANPSEGGSVSGGGTFSHGQSCTVHATPNTCYRFVSWTENSNVVSTQADYNFTVTSNRNLVANFALETYTVTVDIEPEEGGIVSGAGVYTCGDSVTLIAIPNDNFAFVGWFKNGNLISANPTMVTVADYNHHFTVRFAIIEGVGENDGTMEVYPNPANDVLYVLGDGIKKVTVFNALGQVTEVVEAKERINLRINLQHYKEGIYLIRIETSEGTISKQFIKQ